MTARVKGLKSSPLRDFSPFRVWGCFELYFWGKLRSQEGHPSKPTGWPRQSFMCGKGSAVKHAPLYVSFQEVRIRLLQPAETALRGHDLAGRKIPRNSSERVGIPCGIHRKTRWNSLRCWRTRINCRSHISIACMCVCLQVRSSPRSLPSVLFFLLVALHLRFPLPDLFFILCSSLDSRSGSAPHVLLATAFVHACLRNKP